MDRVLYSRLKPTFDDFHHLKEKSLRIDLAGDIFWGDLGGSMLYNLSEGILQNNETYDTD